MIFDNILFKESYLEAHPHFKLAFEFLSQDFSKVDDGVYDLLPNKEVFVTVTHSELRAQTEVFLESHKSYIDIQFLIKGEEKYGHRAINYCREVQKEYNKDRDIAFWDDTPTNYVTLRPYDFLVFYPNDAHAPLIGRGEIRKAIVKIKLVGTQL